MMIIISLRQWEAVALVAPGEMVAEEPALALADLEDVVVMVALAAWQE